MDSARGGYDVSCVAHVHTTYSDGTATVPELLDAARGSGADAVLLTDHDTLAARRDGWEGWHDGVLLVVGVEVSPRIGHYLAFGVEQEIPHGGLGELEIAQAVRAAGGVGFAAHPFSRGSRMLLPALARRVVPPHGWAALALDGGTDGIELWSVTTDGAEGWRTPAAAVRWMRDPVAATDDGPPPEHLRAWDALSARRRVPALGGLDGHAPGVRLDGRVRSPLSHLRTFGLLRTHLVCERPLTGEGPADRATVLAALRAGSAWLARPCVAPADGARLWAELEDGATVAMGGEAALGGSAAPAVLRLRLPRPAAVRILRDGAPVAERTLVDTLDLDVPAPGAYRVETRIDGRVWLLSNPVHLRAGGRG